MTVKEFIGTLESSDRLRIIEGKAEVYVGYLAAFKPFADHEISEEYRKYSGANTEGDTLKLPYGRAHGWCRGCGAAQEWKAG